MMDRTETKNWEFVFARVILGGKSINRDRNQIDFPTVRIG